MSLRHPASTLRSDYDNEQHTEKVARELRKLHSAELHKLYSSPNIIRIQSGRMRWAINVACMGGIINANKISVGKSERVHMRIILK
jgi:hypothetical protein